MEPVLTAAAITGFLALLFQESSKTLAVESVKLALEKRHDIKNKVVEFFGPEFTLLNLSEAQTSEEVRALLEAKPNIAETIQKKVESNPDLFNELLEIIKQQAGNNSSQIIINAKNIAAAGTVIIQNQTNNFL